MVVLQQAQGRAAEDAEVRVRVTLSDAALVLLKGDIELPMQTVLDAQWLRTAVGETPAESFLLRM